ncbi:MAG TPA: hypothetical protein VK692_04945 [Chthoniobacterales bacterium]|nr:hypothetical protein [Chthoniobacterales bacterium]
MKIGSGQCQLTIRRAKDHRITAPADFVSKAKYSIVVERITVSQRKGMFIEPVDGLVMKSRPVAESVEEFSYQLNKHGSAKRTKATPTPEKAAATPTPKP